MNEMEIRQGYDLEQLTPEQLGGEIRLLTTQARKIGFAYAVEIGHRLALAKEKVAHGEWIDWVARETTLSQSSANKMMRLYEETGKRQESLFGVELNSSALTNLSVTNALQLLAFPAEEREQIAQELDAEHLSSRELAEAIKARKAAEQRALEAERALHEAEEGQGLAIAALEEKLDRAKEEKEKILRQAQDDKERAEASAEETKKRLEELEADLRDAEEQADDFSRENERMSLELAEAKRAAEDVGPYRERAETAENAVEKLRDQIKKLKQRPIATVKERDEEAIKQAAAAARAEAKAELEAMQKKLEKAEKEKEKILRQAQDDVKRAAEGVGPYKEKLAEAERETARIREEAEQMRKELAASDRDVTEFGLHFKAVQTEFTAMFAALERIAGRDMPTAKKLNNAVTALLTKFAERTTGSEGRSDAPLEGQIEIGDRDE